MSHVISMHRPDDPRQTAVSDLSKLIPCLMVPRFEPFNLVVRAEKHDHGSDGKLMIQRKKMLPFWP